MFWITSVYFNIRNILPKSGTFLLGHLYVCVCVYIYIYIYIYMVSVFLDPEDIIKLQGPSGTLLKEQGYFNLVQNTGQKGPVLRPRCIGPGRARTPIQFYSILCL